MKRHAAEKIQLKKNGTPHMNIPDLYTNRMRCINQLPLMILQGKMEQIWTDFILFYKGKCVSFSDYRWLFYSIERILYKEVKNQEHPEPMDVTARYAELLDQITIKFVGGEQFPEKRKEVEEEYKEMYRKTSTFFKAVLFKNAPKLADKLTLMKTADAWDQAMTSERRKHVHNQPKVIKAGKRASFPPELSVELTNFKTKYSLEYAKFSRLCGVEVQTIKACLSGKKKFIDKNILEALQSLLVMPDEEISKILYLWKKPCSVAIPKEQYMFFCNKHGIDDTILQYVLQGSENSVKKIMCFPPDYAKYFEYLQTLSATELDRQLRELFIFTKRVWTPAELKKIRYSMNMPSGFLARYMDINNLGPTMMAQLECGEEPITQRIKEKLEVIRLQAPQKRTEYVKAVLEA